MQEGAHGGGHFGDDAISDHEVESFCLSVSALQKLMASEQARRCKVIQLGIIV